VIIDTSAYAFTFLHVALSLIGMASGIVALYVGPLGSRGATCVTALFIVSTLATSLSGFMFPSLRLGPGHVTGAMTLLVFVPTLLALYRYRLAEPWRQVYTIGAATALYLNVFIAVLQAFGKVSILRPLAPSFAAPPLVATQLVVLAIFIALLLLAARRLH
jgi:hypothetical protein